MSQAPRVPTTPRSTRVVGKYKLAEKLGKGAFSEVYLGMNLRNGQFDAVKELQLGDLNNKQLNNIKREIEILQRFQHENIVKYVEQFEFEDKIFIVMEYVENGSLARIVSSFGPLDEHVMANYIKQILHGLQYLHEQGIIHRDIKGANILISKLGTIKLSDFGISKILDADKSRCITDIGGSPC